MLWWVLLVQSAPAPEEPEPLPVRLAIPEGYVDLLNKETGERNRYRRFTMAPEGEIRLHTLLLPGPIAEGMTPPHSFLRPAQLPPEASETTTPRPWQGLEIYAAEHVYEGPDGRLFATTAALPLKDRALLIRLTGPEERAPEAREDMARILEGTRGAPGWLTPLEKKLARQSDWALAAGGILLTLYVACWGAFFRKQPMAAHGLRTAWLLAAGGGLLVPALLGVNLLWGLPAFFVLSLGVRRIKVALDL